jgi:uncharacterized membrane protein
MTSAVTPRMGIALASLVNALVAFYLHLWKLGKVGPLSCASGGGCQIAQFSSYGWFLGVDVALIGAVGWGLICAVALVGTSPRHEDAAWPTKVLAPLVVFAVLFTVRLKYGEWIVLRTFCIWCFPNVVVTALAAALLALDWRRLARSRVPAHDMASAAA